ncbi:MAG: hypothetical protein JJT96_10775 [Opitutales bacterium]|nr:hypothetical protein [Opitutales bacterium]
MDSPATFRSSAPLAQPPLLRLGLAAARANALPALILWITGAGIVAAFYFWPAAQPLFERVSEWRSSFGLLYPMVSTAIFAAIIPYFMQSLQKASAPRHWGIGYFAFLLVFWALKGIEVDVLYRFQAWLFGEGISWQILVPKVFFDQFVYVPLWAAPSLVVGMLFAHGGYSWQSLRRNHLHAGWYRRLVLPVIIPNWLVWVPAVILIYLLPTDLQLPMQNIVLCLWVLMVMFMTGQQSAEALSRPENL